MKTLSAFRSDGRLRPEVRASLLVFLALALFIPLQAGNSLLFGEAQLVGGYMFDSEDAVLYSHGAHDAMQKPSLGIDYVRRFSNDYRDYGVLAIQYRIAYQEDNEPRFASQLYNAYYKQKFPLADVWIGSNKPATGLTSSLDNHAALLADMSMKVFTFDRDWGLGAEKDMDWLKISASATNGSGMRLYNKDGNYLLASRVGLGNFRKSNYNIGVTAVHGKVLEAMGYALGHVDAVGGDYILHEQSYLGLDGTMRYTMAELSFDALTGEFYNQPARALMVRGGLNLLPEDRLKLEGQYMFSKHAVFENTDYSAALSYKLNSDFSFRALYNYHEQDKEQRVVAQVYYYKPLNF
jgi:hypothetical protein